MHSQNNAASSPSVPDNGGGGGQTTRFSPPDLHSLTADYDQTEVSRHVYRDWRCNTHFLIRDPNPRLASTDTYADYSYGGRYLERHSVPHYADRFAETAIMYQQRGNYPTPEHFRMPNSQPAEDSDLMRQSRNAMSPAEVVEWTTELSTAKRIWRGYLCGQLANVGKAALWWSIFGVLVLSLLDTPVAIAITRGPFNLALLISSPFAVAAAERMAMKRILISTTVGRCVIWSVLVPLSWLLIGIQGRNLSLFRYLLISLVFVDGIQVAFSNAVDIDCGGLDSLSTEYNLPLTDFLRYKYNTIHQLVFDSSFVLLTPPVVICLAWICYKFVLHHSWSDLDAGDLNNTVRWLSVESNTTGVLVCGMAVVFGILSALSVAFYVKCIPGSTRARTRQSSSLAGSYGAKLREVVDGFLFVVPDPPLKWRLILLAMETALEDAMVSVIIPMIGIHGTAKLLNSPDKTVAAAVAVIAIAVGKLGGVMAGMVMATKWHTPQIISVDSRYRGLFTMIFSSSLAVGLVPWGYSLMVSHITNVGNAAQAINPATFVPFISPEIVVSDVIPPWTSKESSAVAAWTAARSFIAHPPLYLGPLTMLMGIFLFFVLSTAPKVGFASLIQSLIAQDDVATKVFGFVGLFVTVTDAIVITGINLIFYFCGWQGFNLALWIVFLVYLVHGLMEIFLGPWLILEGATPFEDYIQNDLGQ